MKMNTNLTEIFDSPVKIKIIKYVIKQGFMMTGREVSRICGTSVSMAIKVLKEFEDINLVTSRRAGRSVVWTARHESYAYFVAERLFGEFGIFNPVEHLKRILKDWARLKNRYVDRVVIFGSVAEGTDTDSSDIDLFVQVRNGEHKKEIEKSLEEVADKCAKLYGNVLNPYIVTRNEAAHRKTNGILGNVEKGIKIL